MIKNIIDLLQVTNGETESIKIAQGKYKLPMTFKCMINKIKKEIITMIIEGGEVIIKINHIGKRIQ